MQLNNINYYSDEANKEYLSVSQFKNFYGTLDNNGCEERALAQINGEFLIEPSKSMLQGQYLDACFEGTEDKFKNNNPDLYTLKGELKAEYRQAQSVFERVVQDDLFFKYMDGEKQIIMTANLFGATWKIKMDSYHKDKCIVDLKFIEDIHKKFYSHDLGFVNFIEYWGYDLQLAIYQLVVEKHTGKKLPCYIAVADKKNPPDFEIIQINQYCLDSAIEYYDVENKTKRIIELKKGTIAPSKCGVCEYCREHKVLKNPISSDFLIY